MCDSWNFGTDPKDSFVPKTRSIDDSTLVTSLACDLITRDLIVRDPIPVNQLNHGELHCRSVTYAATSPASTACCPGTCTCRTSDTDPSGCRYPSEDE